MTRPVQHAPATSQPSTDEISVAPTAVGTPPRSASALGTLGFVLVGVFFIAFAVDGGMSVANAIRALIAVAVTQVLPGLLVWRSVRPSDGWWFEDVAMGFVIGVVIAVTAQNLAGLSRLGWLSAATGIAVAAALLLVPASRARIMSARTSPLPAWWGPLVALPALAMLPQVHRLYEVTPLAWSSGARQPYWDAYFHLGLASQLATRGPTRFPFVESEPLAYHWFSHAWVAQVSRASGAALDETLFRFLPVVMPIAIALTVAAAALRLSGRAWTGPVAATLAVATVGANVFGKDIFATINLLYHPRSPSLAFATPLLVGVVVVLAMRWRGELTRGGLTLLALLSIGATGAKGSTLPLIIAGLMLAVVAMWFVDRPRVRELLLDLAVVAASLLVTYVIVFRGGGTDRLRLDPAAAAAQTREAAWLGGLSSAADRTFALALAVGSTVSQAVGLAGLLTSRRTRRDPLTWLLVGVALAAAATVALVAGFGRQYFARGAAPLMALGSTLGLVVLLERLGRRARWAVAMGIVAGPIVALAPVALLGPLEDGGTRRAVAMLAIAAAALAVFAIAAAVVGAPHWRTMTATALVVAVLTAGTTVVLNSMRHIPSTLGFGHPVSSDEIAAARWIRDHSDVDDLLVTNRHCATPPSSRLCDTRRFLVAALSERQALVESWAYTPRAISEDLPVTGRWGYTAEGVPVARRSDRVVQYWKPDVLALNDGFIVAPSAAAAQELQELGVRWVYVDKGLPHATSLEPFAQRRYTSPRVDVYEL